MKGEYWTKPGQRIGVWIGAGTWIALVVFLIWLSLWTAIAENDFSMLALLCNPILWVTYAYLCYLLFPGLLSANDSLTMDECGLLAERGGEEIRLTWEEINRVRVETGRVRIYTKAEKYCLYLSNEVSVGEYIANRIPVDACLAERSDEALRQESVLLIRRSRWRRRASIGIVSPALALAFVEGLLVQDLGDGSVTQEWFVPFALIAIAVSAVLVPLAIACYRKADRIDERAANIQRILERRALEHIDEA